MRRLLRLLLSLALVVTGASLALVGAAPATAAGVTPSVPVHENGPLGTVKVTTGGSDGTATFAGLAGQTVTVATSAGTFATGCDVLVSLRAPDATVLTTPVCGGTAATLPATALTVSGTYAVVIDVQGTATGQLKVGVTGTGPASLTPDAARITLSVPAGGTVDWGFSLAKNQFLYAELGATTPALPDCSASASFRSPTGSTLLSSGCLSSGSSLDRVVTTKAGVHTLRLSNPTGAAFTVPVLLTSGKDVAKALTPGTALSWKTPLAGQQATYTFTGAVGQRPVLDVSAVRFAQTAYLQLKSPTGAVTDAQGIGPGTTFVELQPLTAAGTWSFALDPTGSDVGSATVTLTLVTDQTGTITPGTAKAVTIGQRGQNARLTFSATAGQTVIVQVSGSTYSSSGLSLVRPDGSSFTSGGFGVGSTTVDWTSSPLDATGTWVLLVDPFATGTGTASLTLTLGTGGGGGGTITPGTPVTASVTTVGGTTSYTFGVTAGQRATLSISASSWRSATNGGADGSGYASTALYRPDGSYFGGLTGVTQGKAYAELSSLDANGTWTITVDPDGDSKGSQTMTLGLVTDQTATITPGTARTTTVSAVGQNVSYSFTGTAGQRATGLLTAATWSSATYPGSGYASAYLYRPDGSYFGSLVSTSTTDAYGELGPLDVTGTWRLVVDPPYDSVGSQTTKLALVTDQSGTITPGTAKTVTIAQPGQNAGLTFTAQTGKRVTLSTASAQWDSGIGGGAGAGFAGASLYRPDGSYFGGLSGSTAGATYGESSLLDAAGTWRLVIDPNSDSTGTERVTLGVVTDLSGTITPGTAKTVTTTLGQNASYTFTAQTGKRVTLSTTSSQWDSALGGGAGTGYASAYLYRPDGSYFGSLSSTSTGSAYGELGPLDVTGTWSVVVDPGNDSTGTQQMTLGVVSDQTGTITVGTAKAVSVPVVGQNVLLTFTGAAGRAYGYASTGSTISDAYLTLVRPDGSDYVSLYVGTGTSPAPSPLSTPAARGPCGSTRSAPPPGP